MKRTAIGTAVATITTGIFLLLWYLAFDASDPNLPLRPRRPRPAPSPADSPSAGGSPRKVCGLRIFVHHEGRPLDGASLDLQGPVPTLRRTASTGPDGTAVLKGLDPGEWTILARHPRFLSATRRPLLKEGCDSDLTIELGQGGSLQGRVTDREGRPISGAEVAVLRGEPPEFPDPPRVTRTGEDGRYQIEGIPLLELRLRIRSEHHRPWMSGEIRFRYPGDAHTMDAVLEEGTVLAGRVLTEDGRPLPGVLVTAADEFASSARTDAEGRFTIRGLGDGEVNLSAGAPGYGTAYLRGVRPGGADLEIRLSKAGSLFGGVEADGPPVRFTVTLFRCDPESGRAGQVQGRTFGETPGGEFRFEDVAPGTYRLEAEAEGYESGEPLQVEIRPGQALTGLRIRLRRRD